MYKVIIADDEEDLRRAIIQKIDWNECGFEIIGDAENGIEALEMVENLEPDLLITDIKMPMMTGLELAEKVRSVSPATQIVILSGYDEFEYARQAIQYNIIRYLLKPISASELRCELEKIRTAMDERLKEIRGKDETDLDSLTKRLSVTDFLIPLMLGNIEDTPDEENLEVKAKELGLVKGENSSFVVMVSKFKAQNGEKGTSPEHVRFVNAVMQKYFTSESFFISGRIVTFAVSGEDNFAELLQVPLKELVQSASMVFSQKCSVGVSRSFKKLSLLANAYFEAVSARRYTSDGAGEVRFIDDVEHGISLELEYVEKSVFKLEQLLKVGNREKLEEFLSELYRGDKNNMDYLVIQIMATVLRTVSTVSDKSALSKLMADNQIFSKTTLYDHEENIRTDIVRLCLNARDIISSYQKQDSEVMCDKVLNIIDSEYANEEISLSEISARLGVSPNYLSSLIKKTKKDNFINLLTRKRMEKAKDLLLCTQAKILEVAEKCGYVDQHYFSYCFKKYYGISPNKMRESGRVEA